MKRITIMQANIPLVAYDFLIDRLEILQKVQIIRHISRTDYSPTRRSSTAMNKH